MESQILEITKPGQTLRIKHGFVQVYAGKELLGQVVLDDLLCVLISVPGCLISSNLIDQLTNDNKPIVICGKNYLPSSVLFPVSGKGRQYQVMRAQVEISEPKRKRCWQKIVQSKLLNQAVLLEQLGVNAKHLHALVKKTRSGDPDNCEAQGARFYWQRLFGSDFRRDRGQQGLNSALNYGYTVLRSTMARAIVAAGLHPTFSLHHRNPQNPINLVDDLMEPFRPVCDAMVNIHIGSDDIDELTVQNKQSLAAICTAPVILNGETSPLNIACVKYARHFASKLTGDQSQLLLPQLSSQIEMAAF